MKKIKHFSVVVLSLICLAMYFYSNYIFRQIEIKSHGNAVRQLCDTLITMAGEKKFSGTIEEVKTLTGSGAEEGTESSQYINEVLRGLINSGLVGQKSPFEMTVTPEEYAARVKKIKDFMTGSSPDEIVKAVSRLRKTAPGSLDYETEFNWFWVKGREGEEIQLCGTIKARTVIKSEVILTSPEYETFYNDRKKIVKYFSKISVSALAVLLVYLIFGFISDSFSKRKILKSLPAAIEKLQEYVEHGRYVAAEKLLKHLLDSLPDNTDLISIKSRLDIITRGNTRKAEESFVRFGNLKTKYEKSQFLTPAEWEELQQLPKYLDLPELNIMAGLCQKYLEMTRMGKALKDMRGEVRSLLSEGKVHQAQEKLKQIEKDPDLQEYQENIAMEPALAGRLALPGPQSIDSLRKEVEEKNESSRKKMIEAAEALDKGDINTAERLLREVKELNRELGEPEVLLDQIESSRRAEKLVLLPRKAGKEVVIFKKDVLTAFRKERKAPDIDVSSKRVSRDRHLKLSIVENKVIAEDTGSSGGTYYMGEKIQQVEVEDGGILDLAHSYKIVVHILRGQEMVQSTLVDGTVPDGMKISAGELDRSQKVSGLFLETDDKNYITVLRAVPVGIKSIGITYEKSSPYELVVNEGVFIFKTRHEARILYPGASLEERGVVYQIT